MANRYNQISNGNSETHFSKALMGTVECSRMTVSPQHLTTFNAGDIVPIYCQEILPDEVVNLNLDFVIRQTTLLTPTMGSMTADFYAFFVPNRVVNQSWKAVQGENLSGSWTANSVTLAPLFSPNDESFGSTTSITSVSVPVGSLADYYGFPTQQPIPRKLLEQCHDLKFRGYNMIYNEYFRDQNYQPPIPFSTLNVYEGYFSNPDFSGTIGLNGGSSVALRAADVSDGSYPVGAIVNSLYGDGGSPSISGSGTSLIPGRNGYNRLKALNPPLKANKLHDYFTSVLPQPQKSASVFTPVTGVISSNIPISTSNTRLLTGPHNPLLFSSAVDGGSLNLQGIGFDGDTLSTFTGGSGDSDQSVYPTNLILPANTVIDGLELSINDLRIASAIQQSYEVLARGGSRYRELVKSFFGIEADDPYKDIPQLLGHFRRELDLYQTAQTSPSESGSTPQGNLAAFGYTSNGGHLVSQRFLEHGYLHVFVVVRHKNIYSSYFGRDNFRLSFLDFYNPTLANISNQPVYTREINPFSTSSNDVFGYQEAWAEYRYEPDRVSGYMRPGVPSSLAVWNYADDADTSLVISTGDWLKSNSQQVLDRTLATTSAVAPQLKGQFKFTIDKTLPMPTYSVPGMDII
ncbi:major capsid protein [Dipodfec virus UOA04_Rod_707]|nr:major capsid protein [Dipodfec virus UOA04_Rod_707]